jgi:hypothetical protein
MSYRLEVELVRRAHEEDLLTTAYVFSAEDAVAMTEAGAGAADPISRCRPRTCGEGASVRLPGQRLSTAGES